MTARHAPHLLVAGALLLAFAGGPRLAVAGDPRADQLAAVQKLLAEITRQVTRGEDRNAGPRIAQATRLAASLENELRDLTRVASGDKATEAFAKMSTALQPKLEAALKMLAQMKTVQFVQDDGVDRCKKVSTDLGRKIDEALKASTDEAIDTAIKSLLTEGRKWGPPVQKGLSDFDAKRDALKRAAAEVDRFNGGGDKYWRYLSDETHDSGTAILGYYNEANSRIHDACDRIAKGERNDDIRDAVTTLERRKARRADTREDALADYDRWKERIKGLARWHEQSEESIRETFCTADEDPRTDEVVRTAIEDAADRVQANFKRELATIEDGANDLRKRFGALGDKGEVAEIDKKWAAVERAAKSGLLLGSNHPKIRMQLEVGKKEHLRIQGSSACDDSEITIPGAGLRIDCVKVKGDTCDVIEIKPDTPSGKSKALREAKEYVEALEKLYASDPKAFHSGQLKIFLRCEKGGALKLDPQPMYYELCPSTWDEGEIPAS